jgi:hypothetical protein
MRRAISPEAALKKKRTRRTEDELVGRDTEARAERLAVLGQERPRVGEDGRAHGMRDLDVHFLGRVDCDGPPAPSQPPPASDTEKRTRRYPGP